MNEKVFSTTIAGMEISLTRINNRFTIKYHLEESTKNTYDEAAEKLGYCIMHALQCEGKLD